MGVTQDIPHSLHRSEMSMTQSAALPKQRTTSRIALNPKPPSVPSDTEPKARKTMKP